MELKKTDSLYVNIAGYGRLDAACLLRRKLRTIGVNLKGSGMIHSCFYPADFLAETVLVSLSIRFRARIDSS